MIIILYTNFHFLYCGIKIEQNFGFDSHGYFALFANSYISLVMMGNRKLQ